MQIFTKTEDHFWRNLATRITLVVLTVTVVVWFLPRTTQQRLHYDVGRPWMYTPFIASFDFPIYKSEEIIKEEQDSVLALFQPYYNFHAEVEDEQVGLLISALTQQGAEVPRKVLNTLVDRFHRLYQTGIMEAPAYNRLAEDSTNEVRVVKGKNAESQSVKCFYSTFSAYETLFRDEVLAPYDKVLRRCNLSNYIVPNLVYDKDRSETERADLLSSIAPASGYVMAGQKIIDRGEIVNEQTFRVLASFEKEMERREAESNEIASTLIGQVVYVAILIILFTTYLQLFRRDYFRKSRSIAMLYSILTLFPILVSFIMSHNFMSVYILPLAMAPIFVRVFMDSRTAFVTHVVMVLLCAAAVKYQYEFIIVQIVAGLVAIYSLRELSNRAQVFKTAILVTVASAVELVALQLMQDGDFSKLDHSMHYHLVVNGVLLLLTYPLMYLIERTFGFTSNVTLFELSNTNKGLLRQLSEVAPGTFQHSITVGNLAAEIANKIGAKSLLVRTGALYHDIGKMSNPVFFTENQAGVNPHENMPYSESARILLSHVTDGVKMADKMGLPSIIKNFILTHHGEGITKYFYIKYQNEHPDEEVDKEPFRYPGPNPFTREQAILMMADTVEAASRSLTEYTEESISALVNKLINTQVEEGFFKDCPITFRDIEQAKEVLIDRLMAIYHTRIQYPELRKDNEVVE